MTAVGQVRRRETEEFFGLAPGESQAREYFEKLAGDTIDFLTSAEPSFGSGLVTPWPKGAASFLSENHEEYYPGLKMPAVLVERWRAWNREYEAICSRHPAVELRELIRRLCAGSWPVGRERFVRDWVDAGNPSAPSPLGGGPTSPEVFQRLAELRRACNGWVYWDERSRRVVFAPEEEWQGVRVAQEEQPAREARARNRMVEILARARANTAIWEMLKEWESEENLRMVGWLPAPAAESPDDQHVPRAFQLAVDPMLEEFIAGELKAKDGLTDVEVAMAIRNAVRGDLGLSRIQMWFGTKMRLRQ